MRAGGYLIITGPEGKVERDTFNCQHCQRLVLLSPGKGLGERGGWCWSCTKPICSQCVALNTCDPFEKKLAREEARDRYLRSVLGQG